MTQTTHDQIPMPIMYTIYMVLTALVLTPIPGVDVIFDVVAACLVGSKWVKYSEAAKQIAGTIRQAAPNAVALYNEGFAAYTKSQYTEALRLFTLSANAGDYDAMNYVGIINHEGRGCPISYPLAATWYEKAIVAGERKFAPGNIVNLGVAYSQGQNVTKNPGEAVRLWTIAANTNRMEGQFHLGRAHRDGIAIPVDLQQARHWYGLAAAQGFAPAADALREMDGGRQGEQNQNTGSRNTTMTRATALELLELKEGATLAEMKKSYMRLMQTVHPDKGGSNYFAKQLNEAREVLGF